MSEFREGLTAAQQEAVCHRDGPLLVLAGPGSGKTRVVTYRIAQLLRSDVPPHQIVALTFTNKAADEMQRRLAAIVPAQRVWIGTFHRFCNHLLRHYASCVGLKENFTILDTEDSQRVIKEVLDQESRRLFGWTPAGLLQKISRLKTAMVSAEQFVPSPNDPDGTALAIVYPLYQRMLLRCNAVDFDDLLLHVAVLLKDNPELREKLDDYYRYIMVDEYQDTNRVQYAIVRGLSCNYPNLAVTGDPDQSIYGWRGADIHNILDFERDYPQARVVRLEQNYRSTPEILHVADVLISHNRLRKPKRLFTETPSGVAVRLCAMSDQQAEADAIAYRIAQSLQEGSSANDFAIFYRVSYLSRTIETSLRRHGIPYQVVRGIEFYQRKEVRDALAYLQLIHNPSNDAALLRIINAPRRGLGKTSLKRIQQYASEHGIPLFAALGSAELQSRLSKAAGHSARTLYAWMTHLQNTPPTSVTELVRSVLQESTYLDTLTESGTDEDLERIANLEEFINDAAEFEQSGKEGGLDGFLEHVALVSDVDQWDAQAERVTLMTLHAAKGLEFPCVFIVAIEEKLLPHALCKDLPDKIEEERRLLFVGITRAERELQLSFANRRMAHGMYKTAVMSPFLLELPRDGMDIQEICLSRDGLLRQGISGDELAANFGDDSDWSDEDIDDDDDQMLSLDDDDYVPIVRRDPPESVSPLRLPVSAASLVTPSAPADGSSESDEFRLGEAVIHPTYGPGKLIRLTGSPPRRSATVQFALTGDAKTFILELSPLRAARRPTT